MNVRSLKLVAGFIAFIFLVTNVNPVGYANTGEVSFVPFKTLEIPAEFGQVTERVTGDPAAPALIHIQSAHGNYEAEKNIEKLLGYIEKNSKVRLMLLEGAADKLQPELFRMFPGHPDFSRKVTDKLMQEGFLTGPESFLVESSKKFEGWGIEDLDAYKKDREAFIAVVKADKTAQASLREFRAELERKFTTKLNKDLLALVRQETALDAGTLSFEGWLKVLAQASRNHLKLDLGDAFYQNEYPFLVRYERLQAISSKIDREKARQEAEAFLKDLTKRNISASILSLFRTILGMPEAELFKKSEGTQNYSLLRRAFDLAFEKLPKDFSMKPWPNWTLYAQHVILMQELEGKGLHEETLRLQERILTTLARSADEKEYLVQARELRLLKRLLTLELTRAEYEELAQSKAYGVRSNPNAQGEAVQKVYASAMDFYSTAVVREQHMFQNALQKMGELKTKHAVVVTGGFHADGLKKLAAAKNCSYLQITPRISEVTKRDHEVYLRSILGAREFETSQMSGLLALIAGAKRIVVTGSEQTREWAASIRGLVHGLISAEPISVQPVLSLAFANSGFSRSETRWTVNTVKNLPSVKKLKEWLTENKFNPQISEVTSKVLKITISPEAGVPDIESSIKSLFYDTLFQEVQSDTGLSLSIVPILKEDSLDRSEARDGKSKGQPSPAAATDVWLQDYFPVSGIGKISNVTVSPNGKLVFVHGTLGGKLLTVDGTMIIEIKDHGMIQDVTFSPNGMLMFVVGEDGGKLLKIDGTEVEIPGNEKLYGAVFSPDSERVFVYGERGGKLLRTDGTVISEFSGIGKVDDAIFSPDGGLVFAYGEKGGRLWTADGTEVSSVTHIGEIEGVTFSQDGERVFVHGGRGWKLLKRNGTTLEVPGVEQVSGVTFSSNMKLMFVVGEDGGKLLKIDGTEVVIPGSKRLYGVAFSPDNERVFVYGDQGGKLLRTDGTVISEFSGIGKVYDAVFSPDGNLVFVCQERDGKLLRVDGTVFGVSGIAQISEVTFSPDGRYVFVRGDRGGEVFRLDGTMAAEVPGIGWASKVTFSPDSKLIVVLEPRGSRKSGMKLLKTDGTVFKVPGLEEVYDVKFFPGSELVFVRDERGWKSLKTDGTMLEVPNIEQISNVTVFPDAKLALVEEKQGGKLLTADGTGIASISGSFLGAKAKSTENVFYLFETSGIVRLKRLSSADLDKIGDPYSHKKNKWNLFRKGHEWNLKEAEKLLGLRSEIRSAFNLSKALKSSMPSKEGSKSISGFGNGKAPQVRPVPLRKNDKRVSQLVADGNVSDAVSAQEGFWDPTLEKPKGPQSRSEARGGLKFGVTQEFLAANKDKMVPIFISGGEGPGVNDLFAGTARAIRQQDPALIPVAVRGGIQGFTGPELQKRIAVLDKENIESASMDFHGGVAAGTSRFNLLKEKEDVVKSALKNMSGFHSFLAIGGGDHALFWVKFKTALEADPRFAGVKELGLEVIRKILVNFKTIDGDVPGLAIGAYQAAREARKSIYSRLESHADMRPGKIQAIRIMGATAGILAVLAGGRKPANLKYMTESAWSQHRAFGQTIEELGGNIFIVVPEVPVTLEEIVAQSREIYERTGSNAVLVSEGANILVDRKPAPEVEELFKQLDTLKAQRDGYDPTISMVDWSRVSTLMQNMFDNFIVKALSQKRRADILKALLRAPAYFDGQLDKERLVRTADDIFGVIEPLPTDPLYVKLLTKQSPYFNGGALEAFHSYLLASRDPHGNVKVAETTPEVLVSAAIRESFYRDHLDAGKRKDKDMVPRASEQIGYELRGAPAGIAQKIMTQLLAEKNAEVIQSGRTEVVVMMSPFVDADILEAMQQVDRSKKIQWDDEKGYMNAAMEILRAKDLVQVKTFGEVSDLLKQLGSTINAFHWWSLEELREQGVLIPEGFQEPQGMADKRVLFHKQFPRSEVRVEPLPGAEWVTISEKELGINRAFGTNGIRSDDIEEDGQRRIAAGSAEVWAAVWYENHPGEALPWIAVGFDPRPQGANGFTPGEMGEAKAIAETYAAYGFKVLFVAKAVAAPFMISITGKGVHPKNIYVGVMRTASHNEVVDPKSGNLVSGVKEFIENAPASDALTGKISARINDRELAARAPRIPFDQAVAEGKIAVVQDGDENDPDTVEFNRLSRVFDLAKVGAAFRAKYPNLKIALNTMYGGMSQFGVRVLKAMGFEEGKDLQAFNTTLMNDASVKEKVTGYVEYADATGTVKRSRFKPDPTSPPMRGKEFADFVTSDPAHIIALSIDGDADRLVAELEKEIIPNDIGMLAAYYLAKYKGQKGRVVRTVPTTGGLDALAKALELGEVQVTPVGSKWFAGPNKYYDATLNDILVAVEESGHIGYRYNGELFFDHSIGLAVLMLEMMAETGKTWQEFADEMWAFIKEKTGQERIATVRDGINKDDGAENYYGLVARLGSPAEEAFRLEFASKMEAALAEAGLPWHVNGFDITDNGGAQLKFNGGRNLFPRKSGTDGSVRLYVEVIETERGEVPKLVKVMRSVMDSYVTAGKRSEVRSVERERPQPWFVQKLRSALEHGHVIANHIMVSLHVALISSVLSLPPDQSFRATELVKFIFASPDTAISLAFAYVTYHLGIWWHERAHYWKAVKTLTLKKEYLDKVQNQRFFQRLITEVKMFFLAPWGKFPGIQRMGLGYYVEAPFNLSVAAEGPRKSGLLSWVMFPLSIVLLVVGRFLGFNEHLIWLGRITLGLAFVTLLDRLFADPGKLKELRDREEMAKKASEAVLAKTAGQANWLARAAAVKEQMRTSRNQVVIRADGQVLKAPYGFRNSGMGGRHTEVEYPESNISLQEAMFIPLSVKSQEDGQEMTVALQKRLHELLSKDGNRVMGIGLEGGLSPYVTPEKEGEVPELTLWRLMKRAIEDLGYVPGVDVGIALDAAASEPEIAFREQNNQPDAVGELLYWRHKKQKKTREEQLELYEQAMEEPENIPIIAIEDGFSENDHDGWKELRKRLGDKIFVVGDDLVTTNDAVVERAVDAGLIDVLLVKANQIGTLTETISAMLVATGLSNELIISHRSKKPNDDMEAQLAIALNAMGLKSGGGANTERLIVYQSVARIMKEAQRWKPNANEDNPFSRARISGVTALEEPTNAGIPTVGVSLSTGFLGAAFTGATPLGTSAGTGEAIHLIDSMIEKSAVVERHMELFDQKKDGTFAFKKGLKAADIEAKNDQELTGLWRSAQRFKGKGVKNSARYAETIIAPKVIGKTASELGRLRDIGRMLLKTELETARARGKDVSDPVAIAQRKGNLGMNAILSMDLALARFKAAAEGKELWEIVREEAMDVMAEIVAEHDGKSKQDVLAQYPLEELKVEFQRVTQDYKSQGRKIHEIIREKLGIYDLEAPAGARSEVRAVHTVLDPRRAGNDAATYAAFADALSNRKVLGSSEPLAFDNKALGDGSPSLYENETERSEAREGVLPRVDPTTTSAWRELKQLAKEMKQAKNNLRELFRTDKERVSKFVMNLREDFALDFSKQRITGSVLDALVRLAEQTGVPESIQKMFAGAKINETEGRAVLHVALRNVKRDPGTGRLVAANGPIFMDGKDVMPDVIRVLEQMESFVKAIHSGERVGRTGNKIKNIVTIGIGGSDLGGKMAAKALTPYRLNGKNGVNVYFVSNVDGTDLAEVTRDLDPEETLFMIASKTFTTQETMQNAESARAWVLAHYGLSLSSDEGRKAVNDHFIALSTAVKEVKTFGITPDEKHMFEFWDWVGGRYSVWSAIGLPLATYIGFDNFLKFLEGARIVDDHFRTTPLRQNIPVLKALLNVWNGNFLGARTFAVLPYDQYLGLFPEFAQQFFMESNGKRTDRFGRFVRYVTGLILWGAAGTNGQHSFYQLLHQGKHAFSADFFGVLKTHNPLPGHHEKLFSNVVAQTEALAFGATKQEVARLLAEDAKYQGKDIDWHAAQQTFPGNKPSTTILLDEVSPETLGMMVALYEHQIFVEGAIWNIFSFDQWGVQLGKEVAAKVLDFLTGKKRLDQAAAAGISASGVWAIRKWLERGGGSAAGMQVPAVTQAPAAPVAQETQGETSRSEVREEVLGNISITMGQILPEDREPALEVLVRTAKEVTAGILAVKDAAKAYATEIVRQLFPGHFSAVPAGTLAVAARKKASSLLGIRAPTASDVFVLGHGFFSQDPRVAAGLREVYPATTIVAIVQTAGERAFLEELNLRLAKEGLPPILVTGPESPAELKAHLDKVQGTVRATALLYSAESVPVALRQQIPNTLPVTPRMLKGFLNAVDVLVSALVADIQAQFAMAKSA